MFSKPYVPYVTGPESCPLASVVISKFEAETFNISKASHDICVNALCKQINREITFEESSSILMQYANNNYQALTVQKVLDAFDNHVNDPSKPMQIPEHGKCRMWTFDEDILLLAAIHKYGVGDWKAISKFVGNGRTRSQCSQRWGRAMNPHIQKLAWSPQEEQQLFNLVNQYGEHSWASVAKCIGTRSDVQCRYRYYQILKRRKSLQKPTQTPKVVNILPTQVPAQVPMYLPVVPVAPVTHIAPVAAQPIEEKQTVMSFDTLFNKNLFDCPVEQLIPPLIIRNKEPVEFSAPVVMMQQPISCF